MITLDRMTLQMDVFCRSRTLVSIGGTRRTLCSYNRLCCHPQYSCRTVDRRACMFILVIHTRYAVVPPHSHLYKILLVSSHSSVWRAFWVVWCVKSRVACVLSRLMKLSPSRSAPKPSFGAGDERFERRALMQNKPAVSSKGRFETRPNSGKGGFGTHPNN